MKKILFLLLLVSGIASAQYTPTGVKTRFVNGIGLGTKSDAAFSTVDSLVLYAKADSTLMFKYKGTARALAYAGGSTDFIRNQTTLQAGSNFNISGQGKLLNLRVDSASDLTNEDDAIYIETTDYRKRIGRGIKAVLNWSGGATPFGSTAIEGQSHVNGNIDKDHSNVFQSFAYKTGTARMQYFSNYFASKVLSNNNIGRYYGYYYNSGVGSADSSWAYFSLGPDPSYFSAKVAIADSTLPDASIPYPLFVSKPFSNSTYGLTTAHAGLYSNNFYGIGVGGVLALGGRTGLGSDPYAFAFIRGAKSDLTTYGGFLSLHTSSDGTNAGEVNGGNYERLRINEKGQVMIGDTVALGTDIQLSITGGKTYVENLITDVTAGGNVLWRKAGTNVMMQGVKSGVIGYDNGAITYVYGENPYDIYINNIKRWGIDSLGFQYLYTTPSTSSSGYDILTRNSTTGKTELIASTSTGSGSFVRQDSPTITGTLTATSSGSVTNLIIDNTGSNYGSNIALRRNGTTTGYFGTVGALLGTSDLSPVMYGTSGQGARIYTNGSTLAASWDLSQNLTNSGYVSANSFITPASSFPTEGGQTWKLGKPNGGSGYTLNTTNYVSVEIGGILYKLALIN